MNFDVYLRTEAGQKALNDAQLKLDPWLKHVLRLVDGKRDMLTIGKTCPAGQIDRLVAGLVELGFIAARPAPATPAPAPRLPENPPVPGREGDEGSLSLRSLSRTEARLSVTGHHRPMDADRLQDAKLHLANALLDQAGAKGDSLAMHMTRAQSYAELADRAREAEILIRSLTGGAASGAFSEVVKAQGLSG